jgi:hypothetical protein
MVCSWLGNHDPSGHVSTLAVAHLVETPLAQILVEPSSVKATTSDGGSSIIFFTPHVRCRLGFSDLSQETNASFTRFSQLFDGLLVARSRGKVSSRWCCVWSSGDGGNALVAHYAFVTPQRGGFWSLAFTTDATKNSTQVVLHTVASHKRRCGAQVQR